MNQLMSEVLRYAKFIVSKWIFWAITALDIIFFLASLFWPEIQTSVPVYGAIALVGFFVAAFQVHQDQAARIPDLAMPREPKVQLELEEGNQYSYRWMKWEDVPGITGTHSAPLETGKSLPNAVITIHALLRNKGEVPVDVLNVRGQANITHPYAFMLIKGVTRDGADLAFPITLECGQVLAIDLKAPIYPESSFTDAQIALQTRGMLEDRRKYDFHVYVSFAAPNGEERNEQLVSSVSLTSLLDLYVAHWRKLERHDLIRLATGEDTRA